MAMTTACPVCSTGVYSDAQAPMSNMGSVNPAKHSCVDNGTWRDRTRFGGSVARLRSRLLATPDEKLADWPRVAELKRLAVDGADLA